MAGDFFGHKPISTHFTIVLLFISDSTKFTKYKVTFYAILFWIISFRKDFWLTLSRKRKRLLRPSYSGTHISRFIAMQVRRNDIGGLGMHWSRPIPLPIMMDEKMNWQILLFKALIRPILFKSSDIVRRPQNLKKSPTLFWNYLVTSNQIKRFAGNALERVQRVHEPAHRGRNQRYSFQIDLDYGSSTLHFLQFWNQNVVDILFMVVKSLKVTSGFNSKL